jgi:catechol 2,3-dioxygenase-like lactoylglutathione lyase family enzyme
MYHHISIGVENLDRAAAFYAVSLAPLGYVRLWQDAGGAGYGPEGFKGAAPFTIVQSGADAKPPGQGFHIAFSAPNHEAVDRFHAAALGAGGIDEGKPGIREHYAPDYYAAFVFDPDGHRIEAVVYPPPKN